MYPRVHRGNLTPKKMTRDESCGPASLVKDTPELYPVGPKLDYSTRSRLTGPRLLHGDSQDPEEAGLLSRLAFLRHCIMFWLSSFL